MKVKQFFNQAAAILVAFSLSISAFASEEKGHNDHAHSEGEHGHEHEHTVDAAEFDNEFIIHHVIDSHDWHIFDLPAGDGQYKPVSVPLPVILVDGGVKFFMSSEFEHGHKIVEKGGEHYALYHGKVYKTDEHGMLTFEYELGEKVESFEMPLHAALEDENHEQIMALGAHVVNDQPLDLSISKSVLAMIIAAILMFWIFGAAAKFYKKEGDSKSPKGMARFVEPLVIFVRDEIAKPQIGKKYERFMPFLLTVFFFIWISNLLGLLPFGFNSTGNIAVTFTLAVFTMLITNVNGNKHYWGHIFAPPGVPVALLPIMIPIELIGVFTKPFALMIRLFANITAGHIVVMSLIGVIFKMDSIGWAGLSVPMTLFISVLELLVAALQAYVFTILSALFIGGAVHTTEH